MAGLAQAVPRVAREYDAEQRLERQAAVAAMLRQWRRVDPADISRSFAVVAAPQMIVIANTAQARVAERAAVYVPEVLDGLGLKRAATAPPAFTISARQWVGTAGDGLPTESLLYGAVTHSKVLIGKGLEAEAALASGSKWLSQAFGTLLSDTARGAESAGTYARPVAGYVRMLTPPSCGRCVILAGKWFRKNRGFERHPGCDCIHVPASESMAGDMVTDPAAYLNSLDETGLAKALGSKANAQAWSEYGADANQLINAYRQPGGRRGPGGIPSMKTAQLYGKNVKYTLEGTTTRGVAYHQMSNVRALSRMGEGVRGGRRVVNAPRLMPESIFNLAENQAHATRLLRDHGWLGIT